MAEKNDELGHWREYFRRANSSIFEVIEQAIHVAAADSPAELRRRRDQIAVLLFSSHNQRISIEEEEKKDDFLKEKTNFGVSNYSYDEAEALTEEIEEENQTIEEVLRIKELLLNKDEQSDSALFESLRRLQLMALSVEIIKETEIGKAVNGLRKHSSKQIRSLVRTLIQEWKILVDQWVSSAVLTESTPESVNPTTADEDEGLPSPPLDDGILFTAQASLGEISEFFDGMDDDGNIQISRDHNEDRRMGTKPQTRQRGDIRGETRKPNNVSLPVDRGPVPDDLGHRADQLDCSGKEAQSLEEEFISVGRSKKPMGESGQSKLSISGGASGPGRPHKSDIVVKGSASRAVEPARGSMPKKLSVADHQEKGKSAEEISVRVKLEAAKRKLHEGYQQAENAKKQRTIQVMELQDIPRNKLGSRQPPVKPGSLNRLRASNRHR